MFIFKKLMVKVKKYITYDKANITYKKNEGSNVV